MLTPREKSCLPEAQRRVEPEPLHHAGQRALQPAHYQLSYLGPWPHAESVPIPAGLISVCSDWERQQVPSTSMNMSRVPDQNGVSLLYIMLEIYHSGRKPSMYSAVRILLVSNCSI